MTSVILDRVIYTDYGQFDLAYGSSIGFDGDGIRFFSGQQNGIAAAAAPEGIYIHFARRSGGSHVRIDLADGIPELDPSWEDIVEVSTSYPGGAWYWRSWAGESSGELPSMTAGTYRVRISCKGRDLAASNPPDDEVVDSYLLQIWPAELQSDQILKTESQSAERRHRQVRELLAKVGAS